MSMDSGTYRRWKASREIVRSKKLFKASSILVLAWAGMMRGLQMNLYCPGTGSGGTSIFES